jgi:hypothetical protein
MVAVVETITPAEPGFRDEVQLDGRVLGVDLGQSSDPTAIAGIEHRRIFKHHHSGVRRQIGERFNVCHLQRLQLGLSYPAQVQEVARLLARPPLVGSHCELVIDATGVGVAVADLFNTAQFNPLRITITSGTDQSWQGARGWHVAKGILISTLDAAQRRTAVRERIA